MQIKTLGLAAAMSAVLGGPALAEDAVGHWFGKVTTPVGVDLTITAHINKAATGGLEGYAETPAHLAHPFQRALVISLLNPKAILFLLSFFVQFIDPHFETPAIPFLILSAILMSFSALYLCVLIVAGARLAENFRRRQRLSASLSAAVGGLFVGFGAKSATASLN